MDTYRRNQRKWDKLAPHFDRRRQTKSLRAVQRQAIDILELRAGMTFLDLGCGTGWGLQYAHEQTAGKGSYIGLDLSEQMIAIANARFKDKPEVQLVCGAAEHFHHPPQSIDRIILTNTFHHLAAPKTVLRHINRLLKPEGRFCIADMTADRWLAKIVNTILQHTEKSHVSFYTSQQYESMFRETGLEIAAVHPLSPYFKLLVGRRTAIIK